MLRVTLVLSAADRQALQHLIKHDPHWRVRERAQSVLLLATGLQRKPDVFVGCGALLCHSDMAE